MDRKIHKTRSRALPAALAAVGRPRPALALSVPYALAVLGAGILYLTFEREP